MLRASLTDVQRAEGVRLDDGPRRLAGASRGDNRRIVRIPPAFASFEDDLSALLATHRVQVRHRIRVPTTDPAERSFVEDRRRTNGDRPGFGVAGDCRLHLDGSAGLGRRGVAAAPTP
jgi:hypothetical protein